MVVLTFDWLGFNVASQKGISRNFLLKIRLKF